jgi:hypothetical protein
VPLLAAAGPEERARRAEAIYHGLPLPACYGAVRHLHEAVGAQNVNRKSENGSGDLAARSEAGVRINFRRQQGMLYLLKQYSTREHSVGVSRVCITIRTCVAPVAV